AAAAGGQQAQHHHAEQQEAKHALHCGDSPLVSAKSFRWADERPAFVRDDHLLLQPAGAEAGLVSC
ncbi:MAG TPA: hypothetical protein VGE07_23845, partial [Herpetosiphonaceae bacterium]